MNKKEKPIESSSLDNKNPKPLKYGDMNTVLGRLESLRDYCICKQEVGDCTWMWENYEQALSLTIGRIYMRYMKETGLTPPAIVSKVERKWKLERERIVPVAPLEQGN